MEEFDTELQRVGATSEYTSRSDKDIRDLAMRYIHGEIFGSWDIRKSDEHLMGSIFMPLLFMDEIARKKLIRDVNHVYEEYSKAGPRAINGYPVFMSFSILDKEDSLRLLTKINELKDAMDSVA